MYVNTIKRIMSARGEEEAFSAENDLLALCSSGYGSQGLDPLLEIAESEEEKYHSGIRGLASRYYTQFIFRLGLLSKNKKKAIKRLSTNPSPLVRLGVVIGLGESSPRSLFNFKLSVLHELKKDPHPSVSQEAEDLLNQISIETRTCFKCNKVSKKRHGRLSEGRFMCSECYSHHSFLKWDDWAWVNDVYRLVNLKKPDDAIDLFFDKVDEFLSNGKFEVVDEIIRKIDLYRLDPNLIVSVLIITFAAKDHLPSRKDLVNRARIRLLEEMNPERVDRLISKRE